MPCIEKPGSLGKVAGVGVIAVLAAIAAPAVMAIKNKIRGEALESAMQKTCRTVRDSGIFPDPPNGTPEAESIKDLLEQPRNLDGTGFACSMWGDVQLAQSQIAAAVLRTEAQANRQTYPSRPLVADAAGEAIRMLDEASRCQEMPQASSCLDAAKALAFARGGKPVPSELLERMLAALPVEKSH